MNNPETGYHPEMVAGELEFKKRQKASLEATLKEFKKIVGEEV